MSNSTTNLDLISASQANKEATANSLFDAASPAMLYGRRAVTTAGLTWGYFGGAVSISGTPTVIPNGTVTLAASATNYVEANPTTGAVTANTTGFTAGRTPLYTVVTGSATVTSYTDLRMLGGGSAALAAHEAAADPHPQYLTQAEGDVRYSEGGVSLGVTNHLTILARTANQAVPHATWAPVSWDTEIQDDVGAFSSGTPTQVIVPSGSTKARITFYVAWENVNSGNRYMTIDQISGGVTTTIKGAAYVSVSESFYTLVTRWLTVAPGDALVFNVHQTSGSTRNLSGTGFGGPTDLQIEWAN